MRALILWILLTAFSYSATFELSWTLRPADEKISRYDIYQNDRYIGWSLGPKYRVQVITPGYHTFYVVAVNVWGPGLKSKTVTSPRVK